MTDSNERDAAREARNAYQREWRRKNPEKVRATMNRYWDKKAAELAAQDKEQEVTKRDRRNHDHTEADDHPSGREAAGHP